MAAVFLPLTWGRVYVAPGPGQVPCDGWRGFGGLSLPANLPSGLQILIQTLSFSSVAGGGQQLALSNAVEITGR